MQVGFESEATNLTRDDLEGDKDAFVRDRKREATVRVRADAQALPELAGESVSGVRLSGDGRHVIGTVRDRNTGLDQIIVVDRDADGDGAFDEPDAVRTTEMSRSLSSSPGDAPSRFPAISADGRFVAFVSLAGNIGNFVPSPNAIHWHVLLHDRDSDENGVFDERPVTSTALDLRLQSLELAQSWLTSSRRR